MTEGTCGNFNTFYVFSVRMRTKRMTDCVVCIEWMYDANGMAGAACVFPGAELPYSDAVAAAVGKTFNVTYTVTYIPDEDEDMIPDQDATIVNMNYAVTIVE